MKLNNIMDLEISTTHTVTMWND